jgi:hypothetical protein
MKQFTIDYSFRNRTEAEEWLDPHKVVFPRWYRVAWLILTVVTIPLEMVCETIFMFLGFVARIGSVALWATNPITDDKQTESEEES